MKRFKATAFGTFASPSNRGVIYIDPNHKNEAHHSPILTELEAKSARERELIEEGDGEAVDENGNAIEDTTSLSSVNQERLSEIADAADEATGSIANLDSVRTTAWPDADRVLGGAGPASADLVTPASTQIAGTQMAAPDGSGGGDADDAAPAPRAARTAANKTPR